MLKRSRSSRGSEGEGEGEGESPKFPARKCGAKVRSDDGGEKEVRGFGDPSGEGGSLREQGRSVSQRFTAELQSKGGTPRHLRSSSWGLKERAGRKDEVLTRKEERADVRVSGEGGGLREEGRSGSHREQRSGTSRGYPKDSSWRGRGKEERADVRGRKDEDLRGKGASPRHPKGLKDRDLSASLASLRRGLPEKGYLKEVRGGFGDPSGEGGRLREDGRSGSQRFTTELPQRSGTCRGGTPRHPKYSSCRLKERVDARSWKDVDLRGRGERADFRGWKDVDLRGRGEKADVRDRKDVDLRGRGERADVRGRKDVDLRGRGERADVRGRKDEDLRGRGERADVRGCKDEDSRGKGHPKGYSRGLKDRKAKNGDLSGSVRGLDSPRGLTEKGRFTTEQRSGTSRGGTPKHPEDSSSGLKERGGRKDGDLRGIPEKHSDGYADKEVDSQVKWSDFRNLCQTHLPLLEDAKKTAMNLHDDYIVPCGMYQMKLSPRGEINHYMAKSHKEVLNGHFTDSTMIVPNSSSNEENKKIVLAALASKVPYEILKRKR